MNWEKCPYIEKVFKIGGQFYPAIIGQFYAAIDNGQENKSARCSELYFDHGSRFLLNG